MEQYLRVIHYNVKPLPVKKLFPFLLSLSIIIPGTGWGQQTPGNQKFIPDSLSTEDSVSVPDDSGYESNALVVKTVNDTIWFIFRDLTLKFPTPSKYSVLNRTFSEKDTFYLSLGMGHEQNGLEFILMNSKLKDVRMEESYISYFTDKVGKDGYRIDKKDWDNQNPEGWKPLIITETGYFKTNYNGELMDTVKNTPLFLAGSITIDGIRIGQRHILYKITGTKENGQQVEYIMVFLILGC